MSEIGVSEKGIPASVLFFQTATIGFRMMAGLMLSTEEVVTIGYDKGE